MYGHHGYTIHGSYIYLERDGTVRITDPNLIHLLQQAACGGPYSVSIQYFCHPRSQCGPGCCMHGQAYPGGYAGGYGAGPGFPGHAGFGGPADTKPLTNC